MDEQMDGWTDGWIDGWVDRQMCLAENHERFHGVDES